MMETWVAVSHWSATNSDEHQVIGVFPHVFAAKNACAEDAERLNQQNSVLTGWSPTLSWKEHQGVHFASARRSYYIRRLELEVPFDPYGPEYGPEVSRLSWWTRRKDYDDVWLMEIHAERRGESSWCVWNGQRPGGFLTREKTWSRKAEYHPTHVVHEMVPEVITRDTKLHFKHVPEDEIYVVTGFLPDVWE